MWTSRARGALGVGLSAAVWAAISVFPSRLARDPSPEAPVPPRDLPTPEGAPSPLPGHIEAQLAERLPGLAPDRRGRLAATIVIEAEAARIDPLLVLAVIEVESGFDAGALSEAGAVGLMQLRGPTLRRELERHGLLASDPADPTVNVQAGVRYLRRLLDAFGAEELALMAYNAGPNRILGYLRDGAIPDRFQVYPRRIKAEQRRLRRRVEQVRSPALAVAGPPPLAVE